MRSKELSIYIHIPFCVKKCAYCDFLSFSGNVAQIDAYVNKLKWELKQRAEIYSQYKIKTVFFGGGTPSILPAEAIEGIMDIIRRDYSLDQDSEISIEANPGTFDEQKLMVWKNAGINRLSIGCQSLDDKELELLGRIHKAEDFYRVYEKARNRGYNNINIDLITALPGQKPESFYESLGKLIKLKPEHVSIYSLIIEEGTEFYNRYAKADELRAKGDEQDCLPSEEEERKCVHDATVLLEKAGYEQYEISNYSLFGYESRHNLTYWNRGDYAGFGLGAAGCVDDVRTKNTESFAEYLSMPSLQELFVEKQILSQEEVISEAMFLGLRLKQGISISGYYNRYGVDPTDVFGEWIDRMCREKLIQIDEDHVRLTEKGLDLANYVMAGFV